MPRAFIVRRYQPVRTSDGSGGSLRTPPDDRSDFTKLHCSPVSQSDGSVALSVSARAKVKIGDILKIQDTTFLRKQNG